MRTPRLKMGGCGLLARSVLECGGPPPLSEPPASQARSQSAAKSAHSKTCRLVGALLAILALTTSARAQSYSVDWSKIAGGGGSSTGGVYSVSGTIGQPDASGELSGGQYSVVGGFWSFIAVPTPGAPPLTIRGTTTNAVLVTWPSPSPGYALQQNSDINTTNWLPVLPAPVDNGTNKTVIITPASGRKFFRLVK